MRENPLVEGEIYHVLSRSIARFVIFNDDDDYHRFTEIVNLYRYEEFNYKYSSFLRLEVIRQKAIINDFSRKMPSIEIIAYCIMPTHFHLILKQTGSIGISLYMAKVLNSYTRYFNIRHKRKGPLWEGKFKSILISTDEQLLHLTRYIHLNPVSVGIIDNSEDWVYSSYKNYIEETKSGIYISKNLFGLTPEKYKKFVLDHAGYQRQLSLIKRIIIENYTG